MIKAFRGPNAYLSNFYAVNVDFEGKTYPTVENAYQAAKSLDQDVRSKIADMTPGKAKKFAHNGMILRGDWRDVSLGIMEVLVRQKFEQEPLRTMLLESGEEELVEGNSWHDSWYGQCTCPKCEGIVWYNHLGKILMKIREEIRRVELKW